MRNYVRIFLIVVCLTVLFPPLPAYAVQYEYEYDYYTGCDATFTQVGIALQDCDGGWSYYGTTSGDWRRTFKINCNTNQIVLVTYEHYCSGTWVPISSASMGACDLDC
jgi:hypothetical protein